MPSERYNHGSVMHDDGTLYVYGGFSQRCQDYCDDIWFFDIYLRVSFSTLCGYPLLQSTISFFNPPVVSWHMFPPQSWRQVYAAGALTKLYSDVFFEEIVQVDASKVPVDNTTSRFAGTPVANVT